MPRITRVECKQLYWDTLAPLRKLPNFQSYRRQMEAIVRSWAAGEQRDPVRGKPFTSKGKLGGIWHVHLSDRPDVVAFYAVDGPTLQWVMMGSHSDYGYSKGTAAAEKTARKIANAIADGHVPSPGWKTFSWKRPGDVFSNPHLSELSSNALSALMSDLLRETVDAPKFQMVHGHAIEDAPYEQMAAWIDEAELALRRANEVRAARPLGPEGFLQEIMSRQSQPTP